MVYEFEGKSEKEAIEIAAKELGLERDAFDVEIPEINAVYTHMLGHDCHSIVAGAGHADALIAQPFQYSAVLIFQLCALKRVHIRPSITFRDAGFSFVRRAGVFIGHFQENQVGKLFKIIAVGYAIVP